METAIAEAGIKPLGRVSDHLRRCSDASAARPVADFVEMPGQPDGMTTKVIHQAKGETYDAVMVVSRGKSRHRPDDLTQWLGGHEGSTDDARRTGYVAVTRPRLLLAIAVSEGTCEDALARLEGVFEVLPW